MSDQVPQAKQGFAFGSVVLIGGAIFVFYLLALAASDFLVRRPMIALIFNPYNAAALISRAESALEAEPPNLDSARRYATAALRADPWAPRVHRTLTRIAAEAENQEAANAMARLAGRFARDGDAQFDLLQRALAVQDFDEVAHRLDMIYRGQGPQVWFRLGQAFANIVAFPGPAAALAKKLGENPPWRKSFIEQSFSRASSIDALIAFYDMLPNPRDNETRIFLDRLVLERRFDVAHALFLRMLPPDRRDEARLLYNARFQHGVSNLPFDWVFTRMPNTLTELRRDRNRRLLRVSFFGGRTPFRNVNHLMALTPGDYVFSGMEQALSLNNPRGMRWRIACTGKPDENLATTDLLVGDVPMRPFQVAFTVPPDCPFQILQLELAFRVALEQEATGSVIFADLAVAPRSQEKSP